LPELLGDDLGRSVGVQKTIAQDLADDLIGAPIIGFGAGLLGLQSGEAALLVSFEQLVVALATKPIFLSDGADLSFQALAFDEHEEAAGELVGGSDGQGSHRTGELAGIGMKLEGRIHEGKVTGGGRIV
jgi:hypothetical protein